jgi:hypothetical protein
MADADEEFLSRWSRRKRSDADENDPPAAEAVEAATSDEAAAPEAADEAGDPEVVARLPDIESLDESSDFSAFMAEGVPEALRRRALRRLWRLNPLFANLDGLNDYDEDFTIGASLAEGVKTIYKVGRGMLSDEEETGGQESAETAEPAAPAPTEAEPDSPTEEAGAPEAVTDEDAAPARLPEVAESVAPEVEAAPCEAPPARAPGSGRSAAARRWGESSG